MGAGCRKRTLSSPSFSAIIKLTPPGALSRLVCAAIKYPYNFTWDDTGRFRIMKADLIKLGVKVGSKMLFYKEAGATGQVQINNANWGPIDTVSDGKGDQNCVVKVFDAAMMEAVNSISDGWSDTAFAWFCIGYN